MASILSSFKLTRREIVDELVLRVNNQIRVQIDALEQEVRKVRQAGEDRKKVWRNEIIESVTGDAAYKALAKAAKVLGCEVNANYDDHRKTVLCSVSATIAPTAVPPMPVAQTPEEQQQLNTIHQRMQSLRRHVDRDSLGHFLASQDEELSKELDAVATKVAEAAANHVAALDEAYNEAQVRRLN